MHVFKHYIKGLMLYMLFNLFFPLKIVFLRFYYVVEYNCSLFLVITVYLPCSIHSTVNGYWLVSSSLLVGIMLL